MFLQRHLRHARAIYARKLQATAALDTFITISLKINNETKGMEILFVSHKQ